MRSPTYLILAACLGVALAVPSAGSSSSASSDSTSSSAKAASGQKAAVDPSKVFMKRDYKAPSVADPHGGGGYPQEDNGYYYYYYPVEEHGDKGVKKEKGLSDIEKVLIPLILITVFLGILAADAIGLVPTINLPPITIPAINPVIPGIGKRDVSSNQYDYFSWGYLERLTASVLEAVETEECLPRLICESGKYAEGRTIFLGLLDFFTPSKYYGNMKIFKESALKKSDCLRFSCSYAENQAL